AVIVAGSQQELAVKLAVFFRVLPLVAAPIVGAAIDTFFEIFGLQDGKMRRLTEIEMALFLADREFVMSRALCLHRPQARLRSARPGVITFVRHALINAGLNR